MSLAPGTRLGIYEIVAPLGAGGMGEVYRARDARLGREVAVKVLPTPLASSPDRLARFEREARTVAGLNHPNIVTLFSVEDQGGVRFITMELVEGQSLDRLVVPGGLALARLLELSIPLADALEAAHERGVVHRDLKPGNVMVTPEGRVKVLDFGLAKGTPTPDPVTSDSALPTRAAPLSLAGQVVGTVPYMAPEQVRGEAADAGTDLFALGIVIYELATGRRPFAGATLADVGSAILRDTPEPVSRLRPELPEELSRIVARCLEKERRDRYRAAREVVQELRLLQRSLERGATGAPAPPDEVIRSLAVLPLENVSHDPAQEYFVDGMTEALISDLSRLKDLRVISRTSAMRYKGVHKALPDIARELNVDAVLEGSALLLGQRVRISVQLVSARRDATLWSDRYDRDLEDVLDMQSEVAAKVAGEIALRVTPREAKRLARRQAVNPEAHIEYLKGQHTAEATSPQAIELSLRHFQRALELDPDFAPAWAGVAHCHNVRASRGMASPAEAFAAARAAARRALELDDTLAQGYAELGWLESGQGDLKGSVRMLERAIELNPGLTSAHTVLGRIYYCTERHAAAQATMLKALSLDPLSMIIHTTVGDAHYYAREYEKSVAYYRKAIELDPRFDGAHTDLARSLEALGQFDEARAQYEEGRRLAGTVAGPSFGLAHLEASMGHRDAARRILAELEAARAQRVVSAWGIAALHASLGDVEEAFRWLETAFDEGATGLVFLRVHPRLDPIRHDPRHAAMVRRVGLDGV
ncbi:MAG: tetratricopeptide repeat protein [Candidatus Eisenbacteria bacterium]|uniref:Tetratricopeptide repeat protein n=1 Tax=Eiseniibacteriota bacterium TaxID=2212470 RepID=A0A538UCA6_UNCEI|nr:MAG: tetratricopeptide repeat protein [Candidatus Eisenbacteria bacterium]